MGLFDWLKGSKGNVEEIGDFIWISKPAKDAGVVQAVRKSLDRPDSPTVVLIIAHFDDTLADIRQRLEDDGIVDSRVFVLRSDELQSVENSLLGLNEPQLVEMIVAERHPLLQRDDALVEFARQCRCRFRIAHHLSLDDRLIKVFAGEWVRNVLGQLGMKEDEPIQSRMVSRRIREAQKNLARTAADSSVTESAEAWFERNVD